MIDVSGHIRAVRRDRGFENKDIPLEVNCAGYQLVDDINFSKRRPAGRLDYQILYLTKGKGTFLINGTYHKLDAGSLIIYKPYEVQCYSYLSEDKPEIFWIHFTGYDCEKVLLEHNLTEGFYQIGKNTEIRLVLKNIIFELQLKKNNFKEVTLHLFHVFLLLLQRSINQKQDLLNQERKLDKLILSLNDGYAKDWNIEKMSAFCNMSESRFQHLFKEQYGITPMQYVLRLRINKAKELLICGEISIGTVAKQVGFNDPLYFSRLFKKFEGLTPREFVNQ